MTAVSSLREAASPDRPQSTSHASGNAAFAPMRYLPGIVLAVIVTAAAYAMRQIPGLAIFSPMILAVVIGIVYANLVGTPENTRAGIAFCQRSVLRFAIVLLGGLASAAAPPASAQGSAPGAPGANATWDEPSVTGFADSLGSSSKVWYTIGNGELENAFYPETDTPDTFGLQYAVTNGSSFTELETTGTTHAISLLNNSSLVWKQVNTADNGDFTITPMSTTYAAYAFLNTQSPALKDVRVRQAITLAFDYQGAFKQVFGGQGTIGDGPLPKYLSCRADLPTSAQNVDKAKQLLQEAGATGLKLNIFYQPTLSQLTDLATLLASNLKAIGIDAQLKTTTYPQYLDMLKSPSTTADISMVYEGAPYPDPGTTLFQTYDSQFVGRGSNFGQYSNPKVDHLIQTAIGTADESQRCDMYKQAQQLIANDYVSLNIALGEASVVARKGVTGIVASPIHVYFDEMAIRTGS